MLAQSSWNLDNFQVTGMFGEERVAVLVPEA